MIPKLFLPDKIFGIRLIPQKIVGISLSGESVNAVITLADKKKTSIERVISVPLAAGTQANYRQRAIATLEKIREEIGDADHIRVALPSAVVILKELSFPFNDREKIKRVLPFELESRLPFAIDDAIIDFVINQQEESGTNILVAAVRSQDLADALALYQSAHIEPTEVSIDLFALHALYEQIPEYADIKEGTAINDMSSHSTRLAFLQNGVLRLMRTFPKGLNTLVDTIASESKENVSATLDYVTSGSLEDKIDNPLAQMAHKQLINYLNEVQFTLNSYCQTLKFYGPINNIFFCGTADLIPSLPSFATQILQTPCSFLDARRITENPLIVCLPEAAQSLSTAYAQATGLACPSKRYEDFNLRTGRFALTNLPLEKSQLLMSFALTAILCITLGAVGYLQMRNLQSHHDVIQKTLTTNLSQPLLSPTQNILDSQDQERIRRSMNSLSALIASTNLLLQQKETVWLVINHRSIDPLKIFLDLTRTIDRGSYSITTQSLDIEREKETVARLQINLSSKTNDNDWQAFTKFIQGLTTSRYFTLGEYKEEPGEMGGVQVLLSLYEKSKL